MCLSFQSYYLKIMFTPFMNMLVRNQDWFFTLTANITYTDEPKKSPCLKSWKVSFNLPLVSLLEIISPSKLTQDRATLLTDYHVSPLRFLQWSNCTTFTLNIICVNKNVQFLKTEVN